MHSSGDNKARRKTGMSGAQEKAAMDVHLSARSCGFLVATVHSEDISPNLGKHV